MDQHHHHDDDDDNVEVKMVRDNLQELREIPCLDGYHFVNFAPGDEDEWVALYAAAEPFLTIDRALFDEKFRGDVKALCERMIFMVQNNGNETRRRRRRDIIGTAVAWYDDKQHTTEWGRLHWVAIHPDFQGKGLSKPLVATTLQRLVKLGHSKAYLITSTGRVAAIKLYLQFGFVPEPRNEMEQDAWGRFFEKHGN